MRNRKRGAALVEVALLISLIAIVCVISLRDTGRAVSCVFTKEALMMRGMNIVVVSSFGQGADLSKDGCVDFDDLLALAQGYNNPAYHPPFTFDDLLYLAQNFGDCVC